MEEQTQPLPSVAPRLGKDSRYMSSNTVIHTFIP